MRRAKDRDMVQAFAPDRADDRSTSPFCQGECAATGIRVSTRRELRARGVFGFGRFTNGAIPVLHSMRLGGPSRSRQWTESWYGFEHMSGGMLRTS